MPPWLIIWIVRLCSGERFRKATPGELRTFGAVFVLLPAGLAGMGLLGHRILDRGTYWSILLYTAATVIVLWTAFKVWARFIPAKVSWILGGMEWVTLFYLALSGRLL
jgi:hypothetical protein